MAQFNKIRKITDALPKKANNRSDVVQNTLTRMTEDIGGNLSEFIDNAQPMKTYWYHIHRPTTVAGPGFDDNDGPYSGAVKYTLIKDYVCYGYMDERPVDVETGNNLDIRYKVGNMTFLHLPNTLTPFPGDRLSLAYENHRFLYKVIHSTPVQFKNKTYIRTEVAKDEIQPADYYAEDFIKDGLIFETRQYIEGNVGSGYTPFMTKSDVDTINTLEAYKNEIMELYNDSFYNVDKNIYATIDPSEAGCLHYTPLMVDLQMEFRTLYTDTVNTILTHETLINSKSKFTYKRSIIRRFLNRLPGAWDKLKEEGITFTKYRYMPSILSPMYKIQSYFNDNGNYMIYDYYHGDDMFYDKEGKLIATIQDKTTIKIPNGLYELFDKYTNDTLDAKWMIEFLESYDFELCLCCMLMAFLVLTITDQVIESSKKLNTDSGLLS